MIAVLSTLVFMAAPVTPADLDREPTALLVDVRSAADFAAAHIAGAVHVSPRDAARSPVLRSPDVVLVDGGFPGGAADTLGAARGLRVLAGGLRAWCASGRSLTGPCGDTAMVSPADAARARLVVLGTDADVVDLKAVAPEATLVHTVEAMNQAVTRLLGAPGPVVVVGGTGPLPPTVWRLDGDLAALKAARAPAALGTATRLALPKPGSSFGLEQPKGGCGCR
jgi:rhodanese-related sulfurtransferase